jgi:3-dehydroquinate synthase
MREGPENVRKNIREVVQLSIEQKLEIVNEDFTEGNIRRYLNFGHTLGHALEKVTNYSLLNHGEAVYWGILAASFISNKKGFLNDQVFEEIIRIMEKYDFGISVENLDQDAVRDAIYYDKKRIRDKIHWVLLEGVGQPVIETDVPKSMITDAIQYAQEFTKNQSYAAQEREETR